MRKNRWVVLAALAASCGGSRDATRSEPPPVAVEKPPAAPPAPPPEAKVGPALAEDTPTKTPSGGNFLAPKGWFLTTRDDLIVLEDPDRQLKTTLVELKADSGQAAIDAAWKKADPAFARKVRQSVEPPAREGWDATVQNVYETFTTEHRFVIAAARRKGDIWYVALIDGDQGAIDRRGAQLQTALLSLKPPGLEKESFAGRTPHKLEGDAARAFESFVTEAMAQTQTPGAAIAVVQDGKVVYEKGFGTRELGGKTKVTPKTLFLIGSTTKSLTTLLMAILVDQGKMRWDTPVVELMPGFALGDAEATKKLTMKHTVCACTGLPRQDMEFIFEKAAAPEATLARMATMKPTTGFGETFQYSNSLVSSGGYIAAHLLAPLKPLGPAYDAAMKSRVFTPLGMTGTTFDFAVARKQDHASPHGHNLQLEMHAFPLETEELLTAVRPAGGAWSNVHDISRWIMLELSKGKLPSGKQLVSEENLLARRQPQVKVSDEVSYGLGLFVETYRGLPLIHHGGNTLGFTTDVFMMPEQGIGAVVLTNAGGANSFRNAVRRKLFEVLFDGADEAKGNLTFALETRKKILEKEMKKMTLAPEKAWLDGVAGAYSNESLGKATVTVTGDKGVFDAGEWKSTIGRLREDDGTIKLVLLNPPLAGFEFIPSEKDGKRLLTIDLPQQKYDFVTQK